MSETLYQNKLELHYHFDDGQSHSMDAAIRNKCEHELLLMVTSVARELGISIKTETEAYEEGGLREFYIFIGTAEGQVVMSLANFTVTLIGIILSRIPLKKSKLDKVEQKLSIEEKKLNIQLLKKELEEKNIENANIKIEKIEYTISNNIKIIKHKSNFYKTLYNYPKVNKITIVELNEKNEPLDEPRTVNRSDFEKFILESDNLEPIKDENASIEIISPVFKLGKYKWRGIYQTSIIEFNMMDKDFKNEVVNEGISFTSGTFIDCVLEIEQKIDDLGNIFNSNYSVLTVLKRHSEGKSIETKQGIIYRRKKDADERQIGLFPTDQLGHN